MARSLFLVCLTGLICVAYCDSEDIGLTSLGKVMQIQEAMMGQSADRADSGVSGRTLGESDVASLEPAVKQMPDEDSMVARVHQQKLHQMVKLQKLIAGLKQSAEPDLGESDEQSPLEKLMNPTSDESDPISEVSSYLQGVDRVSPSEMSDLKRFYIDQTVKALHKLHGESHQIMQRYADKELRSLADDNLSFEGLSVGVQNGMDKSKSSFQTMQACLAETSRLAKFLADIRKIKAHPWHDDWSSKDEAKAESLIRLHQSETEISDGIEELMARVAQGLPLEEPSETTKTTTAQPAATPAPSEQMPKAAATPTPEKQSKAAAPAPEKQLKAAATPAKTIHVPMQRVGQQLKNLILSKLDQALEIMDKQKHGKKGLDHRQEEALNLLLKQITRHVLRSTVSYEEWSDAGSLREEAQAVKDSDPGRPSKLSSTAQPMHQDKILQHFLQDASIPNKTNPPIPSGISSMMLKGVHLADGSVLKVHIMKPSDHDVDLTESNEYEDLPRRAPRPPTNLFSF